MAHIISSDALTTRVAALFEKCGSTAQEANEVATNLVMANLSGHDSHGVGMAPRYVDAVLEGNLKPNASVLILKDHGMMLGLDGGTGYGQIVGGQAIALAFERVSQHGSCIFSLDVHSAAELAVALDSQHGHDGHTRQNLPHGSFVTPHWAGPVRCCHDVKCFKPHPEPDRREGATKEKFAVRLCAGAPRMTASVAYQV